MTISLAVSLTGTGERLDQVGFACWRLAATGLRGWARYESGAMGEAYDTAKFVTAATAWLNCAGDLLG